MVYVFICFLYNNRTPSFYNDVYIRTFLRVCCEHSSKRHHLVCWVNVLHSHHIPFLIKARYSWFISCPFKCRRNISDYLTFIYRKEHTYKQDSSQLCCCTLSYVFPYHHHSLGLVNYIFSLLSCVSIYKAAQSQEWAELPHAIPTLVINIQKADWSQEDLSAQPAVEKLDIQA